MVAQAPGGVEGVIKRPLIGPAGKTEWRICKDAGLNKESMAQTNVCSCVPPDDRKPTNDEIECCIERLKAEILLIQPTLIVALGEVATGALTGIHRPAKSTRGQFFPLSSRFDYECQVLAMFHPSFIMRQRQWYKTAVDDHKLILSDPPTTSTIEEVRSEITHVSNPTASELKDYLHEARKRDTAFDIETPGELNPRRAAVIGIAFAYEPNKAVGMDLTKGDERWQLVQKFLEDPTARKITQNGSFDLECYYTNGVEVQSMIYDTRLAEHVLNSDMPTDLDFLRGRYTNIPPYKPTKREMRNIANWSSERRITYNNLDAVATLQVAQAQQQIMDKDNWTVLNEIEMPLIPIVNKMERKGMLVDVGTLALMHANIDPQLQEINEKYFAPLGLNPNSPVQLKRYLALPSTDEDTLEKQIKRDHPQAELMQAVLDQRTLHNLAGKYLMKIYQRLENSRIHTHFMSEVAGTGRFASRNPNLQNVPKYMRVIYIPDPGKKIIEGDYKQIELVVWAIIAPEPKLLADLNKGVDVHDMLCREIFNKAKKDLPAHQILREKAVVFGTMGGRTARSIAMEFGVPIITAESWQRAVVAKYPGFNTYLQKQTKVFSTDGLIRTPFGRKRTVQSVTQAFNNPFQSTAADVLKTTLIKMDRLSFDIRLTVHDSVATQADAKDAVEVAHEQQRIMQLPVKQLNNQKFTAEMGIGDNWYELEEIK